MFAHPTGRDRVMAVFGAVLVQVMLVGATVNAAAPNTSHYDFSARLALPPLMDSTQWILVGTKSPTGSCRYDYPDSETTIPESGWVMRTVSVDMNNCAKLVEEGVPTYVPETPNDHVVVHTSGDSFAAESDDGAAMALAASSRGAWQWVGWRDAVGAAVNTDTTQINWSYNGSDTWNGFVDGYVTWKSSTAWQMNYAREAGYQEP
ncbi:hypothetical protein BH24CHL5_BH24CHL5_04990 [soil metagenome]